MFNTNQSILDGVPRQRALPAFDRIPDVVEAKELIVSRFPRDAFPRIGHSIVARMAESFPNWNQCAPEICLACQNSTALRQSLDQVGRELPLGVVAQVSYGCGMGHPRIGLFRKPYFESECAHTYLYHAAPTRVLRGNQACDYHRLDYISRKPTLYCFWVLSEGMTTRGAEELHRRWQNYRYQDSDPNQFDCSKFVTDFALFLASVGCDPNNPFTFGIPSHTIWAPCSSEERGLFAILKNTHRPPALLLFVQDLMTYQRTCSKGYHDGEGWVVTGDAPEFNVTRQ